TSIESKGLLEILDGTSTCPTDATAKQPRRRHGGQGANSCLARSSSHDSRPPFGSPTSFIIRCHYCQELGHIQPHCKQHNLCTYYKRSGYIILDCSKLKNRLSQSNVAPVAVTLLFIL
ncbi:hypothetical protein LINGRAHAP2_LOCUS22578, partial [Linum grandiflorum]